MINDLLAMSLLAMLVLLMIDIELGWKADLFTLQDAKEILELHDAKEKDRSRRANRAPPGKTQSQAFCQDVASSEIIDFSGRGFMIVVLCDRGKLKQFT